MEHLQPVAEQLRVLREGVKLSQLKIGKLIGTTQACINRYETQLSSPPIKVLLWYADYFDVLMDYLFGHTDKLRGILYDFKPRIGENNEELKQFIEMCFEPNSPLSCLFTKKSTPQKERSIKQYSIN
jgi:transcriptional regulator with XRE-family HTH domain